MIYAIIIILLVLIAFVLLILFNYLKLKDIKMCIDTCSSNIDSTLNKKLELVNKLLKDFDSEKIKKKYPYDENASLYEREDTLYNLSFEINKYAKSHKKKKMNDGLRELDSIEENLDGLKDFYNTNLLNYNEIFLKKFFNRIYKFLKLTGYKSFKIRKLEEYEIFKN